MKQRKPSVAVLSEAAWAPPPHGPEPSWIIGRFSDNIWRATDHEGLKVTLDFNRIAPAFRVNAKYFLWSIEYVSDTRFNFRKPSSVKVYYFYFNEYARISKFLATEDITSFAEVTIANIKQYVEQRKTESKVVTFKLAAKLSAFLQKLYLLGPKGAASIPDGLHIHLEKSYISKLIGEAVPEQETPIIPDRIARHMVSIALYYIEFVDDICLLHSLALEYIDSTYYDERAGALKSANLRRAFLQKSNQLTIFESLVDRLSVFPYAAGSFGCISESEPFAMLSVRATGHLLSHLITACFIIFASLTGFRSAEILSIDFGDVVLSGSGTMVRTRVHKDFGRTGGVDIDRPGETLLADVAKTLSKAAQIQKVKSFWMRAHGGRFRNPMLSKVINQFADEVALLDDEWFFTSRQFRRYFAIFFVRRFDGPPDALRRAFCHISESALLSYVKDRSAASYLLDAKRDLAKEIYLDLALSRSNYAAPMTTVRQRNLLKYAASNLPIEQIEQQVESYLEAEGDLTVWPTAWGYCLLSKGDALHAKCGSESGEPLAMEMHPGNCGRCQHLAVGRDQIDFWQSAKAMHQKVLDSSTNTRLLKQASANMIRIADSIIERSQKATGTRE